MNALARGESPPQGGRESAVVRRASTGRRAPERPPSSAADGIVSFGHLARGATRAAVVRAVRSYTTALASDDGGRACSLLVASLRMQVSSVESNGGGGCAGSVAAMFVNEPASARMAMRRSTVDFVRATSTRAFAVMHKHGASNAFYPLQRENGRWLVAAIGPSALPAS
ncbi:MAG: hypothetical protein ACTHM1_01190 [Solirubrobacteraceae bacterium]